MLMCEMPRVVNTARPSPHQQLLLNWKHGYDTDKITGEEPSFDYIKCNAGKNFGIIDVNGDVYPCPTLVDTGKPL